MRGPEMSDGDRSISHCPGNPPLVVSIEILVIALQDYINNILHHSKCIYIHIDYIWTLTNNLVIIQFVKRKRASEYIQFHDLFE